MCEFFAPRRGEYSKRPFLHPKKTKNEAATKLPQGPSPRFETTPDAKRAGMPAMYILRKQPIKQIYRSIDREAQDARIG